MIERPPDLGFHLPHIAPARPRRRRPTGVPSETKRKQGPRDAVPRSNTFILPLSPSIFPRYRCARTFNQNQTDSQIDPGRSIIDSQSHPQPDLRRSIMDPADRIRRAMVDAAFIARRAPRVHHFFAPRTRASGQPIPKSGTTTPSGRAPRWRACPLSAASLHWYWLVKWVTYARSRR